MGGTLHPRLNMQTISNTPSCALSQFYDWSIRRNVSMIDSWDSCYHCLLVGGGGCDVICRWLPVLRLLVSVSRGGWYQVTVSLLPPLQPSPVSWIIWRSRARPGDRRECPLICCLMRPVNSSCWTCSDARNIGRYDSNRYDSIHQVSVPIRYQKSSVLYF